MKTALAFATLLTLTSPGALAQDINTREIDQFVATQIKRFDVPGAGLAIVKDGKIAYAKGYAWSTPIPMPPFYSWRAMPRRRSRRALKA